MIKREEISSCVGATVEGTEDLVIMMGVGGGETGIGILCFVGDASLEYEQRV